MRKTIIVLLFLSIVTSGNSQVDTIANNIYQKDGSLGIGTIDPVIKLHIVDSNTRILLGHQPAYDGPYINIYGSANEGAPMLGLGVANKVYYKFDDTLTMKNWAYLYGNNLNSGIAILPDLQFAKNGIYINRDGRVGINTKKPKTRLDVNGGIKISNSEDQYAGMLRWTGIDFEGYNGSSWLSLTNYSSSFWQSNNNDLHYNQGNIGIGTDSPENALTIEGDETEWPGRVMLSINNKSTSPKSLAYLSAEAGKSGNHTIFGHISETYAANDSPQDLQDYGILSSNGKGLIIGSTRNDLSPGIIKFLSGQSPGTTFNERMRIDTTGYVGIGTKEPKAKLDVNGGIKISDSEDQYAGMLRWTGIDFEGYDGTEWQSLTETYNNYWRQNNEGVYLEEGNVSIGSTPSTHLLNLQSSISSGIERNFIKLNNLSNGNSSYTGIILKTGESSLQSVIQDYGINYSASHYYDFGGFLNLSNNSKGLMLHANSSSGIIKFYTGHDEIAGAGIERLRIDSIGNIGIGIKKPTAKLQVAAGDIYISDIEKGIIMKSPDGQCWRGILDNNGNLKFTNIKCPETEVATNLQQLKSAQSIFISPNPAENIITINLGHNDQEKTKYSIYNLNGQLVDNGRIKTNIQAIDISSLSDGMYIMNIYDKNGNKLFSDKIIKK